MAKEVNRINRYKESISINSYFYLSTKEKSALELLKVSTITKFANINLRKVFELPYHGESTYKSLLLKQQEIKLHTDLKRRFIKKNTNKNKPKVDTSDSIDSLGFGLKERKALDLLKIESVGQFFDLNLNEVLSLKGFGERTFKYLSLAQVHLKEEIGNETLNQIPIDSLLHKSILDIYFLSEKQKIKLWDYFQNIPIAELRIPETNIRNFEKKSVYQDDSLESMLAYSFKKLLDICENEASFNLLTSILLKYIEISLGKSLEFKELDQGPILNKVNWKAFEKVPITLFSMPINVMCGMKKEIEYLNELKILSEIKIIKLYGLNYNTFELIKYLWSVRINYIEISEKLNKFSELFTTFDGLIKYLLRPKFTQKKLEILKGRNGLGGRKKETLEDLGNKFSLTRE